MLAFTGASAAFSQCSICHCWWAVFFFLFSLSHMKLRYAFPHPSMFASFTDHEIFSPTFAREHQLLSNECLRDNELSSLSSPLLSKQPTDLHHHPQTIAMLMKNISAVSAAFPEKAAFDCSKISAAAAWRGKQTCFIPRIFTFPRKQGDGAHPCTIFSHFKNKCSKLCFLWFALFKKCNSQ